MNILERRNSDCFGEMLWSYVGLAMGPSGVSKCHQCLPRKCWETPSHNKQALPAKPHAARPRLVAPGNALSSWAAVAKGEYPAPLPNWNLWLREGKPLQKNPGPPGWGLGVGLITSPHKTSSIMETASSTINGYNGCSTTTCRTPDDVFIR